MNWQDRYLQPGYDYGKNDVLFELLMGEEYMHEVTPVLDKYKKRTYKIDAIKPDPVKLPNYKID